MSFPKNFIWGAASSAAQIEGAWNEDGRSPSIWDILPEGRVAHSETPHIACDHYHYWREDVELMKKLGLKSYRFSISWSRVIPQRGVVNAKGIQFYKELICALVEAGIEPMITLYHSDLPVWVDEMGGYANQEFPKLFEEYTRVVVNEFSKYVSWWFTFNEPQCYLTDGTVSISEQDKILAVRSIMLAHGLAVKTIREQSARKAYVGIVMMGICAKPIPAILDETEAAEITFSDRGGIMGMGFWLDPLILNRTPEQLNGVFQEDELQIITQPMDFIAVNSYFPANYHDTPDKTNPVLRPGMQRMQMGGALSPDILYWTSKFCYDRYQLPVFFTENGYCEPDYPCLDGKVHDPMRQDYIHRHLLGLRRAIEEGIPVIGYLYWSLLDNFEWSFGYDVRYGLIYVDYDTMHRLPKDSYDFYKEVIRCNGENL